MRIIQTQKIGDKIFTDFEDGSNTETTTKEGKVLYTKFYDKSGKELTSKEFFQNK